MREALELLGKKLHERGLAQPLAPAALGDLLEDVAEVAAHRVEVDPAPMRELVACILRIFHLGPPYRGLCALEAPAMAIFQELLREGCATGAGLDEAMRTLFDELRTIARAVPEWRRRPLQHEAPLAYLALDVWNTLRSATWLVEAVAALWKLDARMRADRKTQVKVVRALAEHARSLRFLGHSAAKRGIVEDRLGDRGYLLESLAIHVPAQVQSDPGRWPRRWQRHLFQCERALVDLTGVTSIWALRRAADSDREVAADVPSTIMILDIGTDGQEVTAIISAAGFMRTHLVEAEAPADFDAVAFIPPQPDEHPFRRALRHRRMAMLLSRNVAPFVHEPRYAQPAEYASLLSLIENPYPSAVPECHHLRFAAAMAVFHGTVEYLFTDQPEALAAAHPGQHVIDAYRGIVFYRLPDDGLGWAILADSWQTHLVPGGHLLTLPLCREARACLPPRDDDPMPSVETLDDLLKDLGCGFRPLSLSRVARSFNAWAVHFGMEPIIAALITGRRPTMLRATSFYLNVSSAHIAAEHQRIVVAMKQVFGTV